MQLSSEARKVSIADSKVTKYIVESFANRGAKYCSMKKICWRIAAFTVIMLAIGSAPVVLWGDSSSVFDELKKSLYHFNKVDEGIYRSGLIHEEDAPLLKELGIKTVLTWDDQKTRIAQEEQFLKFFGIQTVSIPWNGYDRPSDEVVEKSLTLMNAADRKPILVHCFRGSERTGLIVACWRVRTQKWTPDRAYAEMKQYEFRAFLFGHLKEYLYHFADREGISKESAGNIFESAKSNVLYLIYRLRKLNPATWN